MRIIHLTFYKCASQWVRDILTDPEISLISGHPLALGGVDVSAEAGWPQVPDGAFAGPIYSASYYDWLANSSSEDRALVVLRDPRDIVVSLVFSIGFSHIPSAMTRLLRTPILAASDRDRVRIGIYLLTQWADRMRSWATAPTGPRERVVDYRNLIAKPKEEFASICSFLGWNIEPRLLHRVIERHAFESRTGRNPGEVNSFSHLRKGVDGDWRNYFDRELGEEFETTFPGLLTDLGHETDTRWYNALPVNLHPERNSLPAGDERVQELLGKLAAFEDRYTEMGLWKTAAEDRLEQIQELTRTVDRLQARVAAPDIQAERHISQINELTSTVRHLEMISAERLTSVQRLTGMLLELRSMMEDRNAAAEQRLEQVYELTRKVNELEGRLAEPNVLAEDRLAQIRELTAHIRHRNTIAEDRIADIVRLNAVIASQNERVAELDKLSAERLSQVHTLTHNVHQLQHRVSQPDTIAEERLADILKLTAHIRSTESELAEVRKAADDREQVIREIRLSSSYRYGFLPVAKLGSLFR